MAPKRMTANPIAPSRYRAGKAVRGDVASSESESDSESEEERGNTSKKANTRPPPPKAASFPKFITKTQAPTSESSALIAAAQARDLARDPSEPNNDGFVTASDSSDGEDSQTSASGDDDEEEEEDDDSSSSEESSSVQKPRFIAPTFIRKSDRVQSSSTTAPLHAQSAPSTSTTERTDALLESQIQLRAAQRLAAQKAWDDVDESNDVDDRDDLDPEAEHAAWRLRELLRLKRDRTQIELAEKEREEIERRRGLSVAEREREDEEFINKQKEGREEKGKLGYMQKYFHKGAYYQPDNNDDDDDEMDGKDGGVKDVKNRDIVGRRFEDDAANRELLPGFLQIRDMTKLGKKGRTRYKDLKSEDTGSFGGDFRERKGRGDAGGRYDDKSERTGANNVAVGDRRRREDDHDGDDRGDGKRQRT